MTTNQNKRKNKIPLDKQYEYFTTQLRYLDNKIFQCFKLFIQLATIIVGARFYIQTHQPDNSELLISLVNGLFVGVALGVIFLINNNLRSWRGYRKELYDRYIDIPELGEISWSASEWLGCGGIMISTIAFLLIDPLISPFNLPPCCWILGLIVISIFVGALPFLLKMMEKTK